MLDKHVARHLAVLYPPDVADNTCRQLVALMDTYRRPRIARPLDQDDVWLIAYADHVYDDHVPPLQTLRATLDAHLDPLVNGVHVLPFYPSTSDDGFAVVDHRQVDPALGTWDDIRALSRNGRRLMVDAVVNHVSASARQVVDWTDEILTPSPGFDTSKVIRPRTTPLLTAFPGPDGGVRHAWTTFSSDQVDLDYTNPTVLIDMTAVLLEAAAHGATAIRLDAIGFLWKSSGTSCMHLEQTHEVVRLWRTILENCAPGTLLITETNVPHEENVAYLGDGTDEANLVYQFPLAPLVLGAFVWGNAQDLTRWVASLPTPPAPSSWFNFLGCHDGIGLRPVEGHLSPTQVEGLMSLAARAGGGVSYRSNADGDQVPYELNATFIEALIAVADDGLGVQRILAAHAIILALQGVVGLWFGSVFALEGWVEGVAATGDLRQINRQRVSAEALRAALQDQRSMTASVSTGLAELVGLRRDSHAFSPYSDQHVIPSDPWLFVVQRGTGDDRHLVIVSVSSRDRRVRPADLAPGLWLDRLAHPGSRPYGSGDDLVLGPYGVAWLRDLG